MDSTCYRCDRIATTTEHAPPKCFFPESKDIGIDLRRNLITVPSCEDHNTSRSKDDEYAMIFVVTHFETNSFARGQFATKCIRALSRSSAFKSTVFQRRRRIRVGGQESVAVEADRERFDRVIDCTCRALFYAKVQRKLLNQLTLTSPAFRYDNFESDPAGAELGYAVRQVLVSQPKLGDNPEVFWYQLFDQPDQVTALRLTF